ncbi:Flagellar hook-associated protein 1 [Candidatus Magnetaquicoccaceae bacterium FCR-1]|uniref:Flagellar hook-associated protein 1 n=1 Tax=Candidatus Magnetaquiglobus chichijimensis TaxID=3141448 RepID=A0ABQ0C506_9PROT
MSLGSLLNVSKLGIFASQGALQTISHNISNANTTGYTRQTVELESMRGTQADYGGNGVRIADVRRQIDELVDRRLQLGTGELGRLETRDKYTKLIEDVFNDMDGNGLSQGLEGFFDAADTLADNPGNAVARYQLIAKAESVAQDFNKMSEALSESALPLDKEISVVLDDINTRLKAIQEINNTIVRTEASSPALDLKDQRNKMLLELGQIIDIRTIPMENGEVQVMSSRGQELLADATYSAKFGRLTNVKTDTGFSAIGIGGREIGQDKIKGGKLGGLLELRDEVVHGDTGVLSKLESLADELRWQFNRANTVSVGNSMVSDMTGLMYLGSDLDTALSGVVTDNKAATYQGAPVDLSRVTSGRLVFATGTESALTPSAAVDITTTMTLRQVQQAIDALDGVQAEITSDNKLKISAENAGSKLGVVMDESGILAALGVGALISGKGAQDMAVSAELLSNPDLVGQGRLIVKASDAQGLPTAVVHDDANSQGALLMGNLRSTKFMLFGNSASLTGHYATMVGELGSLINQDTESLTAQQAAQTFLSNSRESLSGVSLEEELTDLIRFQRAFQASSKMVSVADDLMQTLIQMV